MSACPTVSHGKWTSGLAVFIQCKLLIGSLPMPVKLEEGEGGASTVNKSIYCKHRQLVKKNRGDYSMNCRSGYFRGEFIFAILMGTNQTENRILANIYSKDKHKICEKCV